jgi:hypothetical protein
VTALDQNTPLAAETLAKIRRNDERDLRHAEKPYGALDPTAWERHVLLAEVDRLNKVVAFLNDVLNGIGGLSMPPELAVQADSQGGTP